LKIIGDLTLETKKINEKVNLPSREAFLRPYIALQKKLIKT